MTDAEYEPFKRGGQARVAGEPMLSNPYAWVAPEYRLWLDGWLDMEAHLTERNGALEYTLGHRR